MSPASSALSWRLLLAVGLLVSGGATSLIIAGAYAYGLRLQYIDVSASGSHNPPAQGKVSLKEQGAPSDDYAVRVRYRAGLSRKVYTTEPFRDPSPGFVVYVFRNDIPIAALEEIALVKLQGEASEAIASAPVRQPAIRWRDATFNAGNYIFRAGNSGRSVYVGLLPFCTSPIRIMLLLGLGLGIGIVAWPLLRFASPRRGMQPSRNSSPEGAGDTLNGMLTRAVDTHSSPRPQ